MTRTSLIALTLAAGGLIVAGCGDDDSADGTLPPIATGPVATASGEASVASSGTFNDADVAFAQGMIAHHQQAIDMAQMALDPNAGASPDVVDLATRIQGAQDPEIALMTSWLTAWGRPMQMDTTGGHDMSSMDSMSSMDDMMTMDEMSSMDGMMTAEEMDDLRAMTGADFDRMWMEMMIRHHQGAIAESQTVKAQGSNPDTLALADQIIAAQSQEIEEMQGLLAG